MLVLLDRDGVINDDLPRGVTTPDEFTLIDGAIDAICQLKAAGHQVAIVSNQSAVGKGWMSMETLDAIHERLREQVREAGGSIDAIYVCTDHPDTPSVRRKPNPGMLLEALKAFKAEASKTPMIGDALRDLEAAHACGCQRYLVKTGKGTKTLEDGLPNHIQPVTICDDLQDAVKQILKV